MNRTVGTIIIIILALLIGGVFWFAYEGISKINNMDEEAIITNEAEEMESWKIFEDEDFHFSFHYPQSAKVDIINPTSEEAEKRVRVRLIGAGSQPASEITDGIFLTVHMEALDKNTQAEAFAEARYKKLSDRSQGVEEPEKLEIAGRTAYVFILETELGNNATHAVIPAKGDRVFVATYSIENPNNRDYQEIVYKILGSLNTGRMTENEGADTLNDMTSEDGMKQ